MPATMQAFFCACIFRYIYFTHKNNQTPMTTRPVDIRFATNDEFQDIFKLNHEIFAEEIPQHLQSQDGLLVDKFHAGNKYVVALNTQENLIGMVCYNSSRPFSLDGKLSNIEQYLPAHDKIVEIRLFAVKPEYRKQGVAISMLQLLIPHLIENGFDLGVISGSVKEQKLYDGIGAVSFGPLVGTDKVPYQPMYFYVSNLKGLFAQ